MTDAMADPLTIQGPGGAPAAGVLDPADRDAMVRTVIAEGGASPASMGAVANAIKNRLATGKFGDTPAAVVHAPGQFEVWQDGSAAKVDPTSPQYAAAGRIVDAVAAGKAPDNTGGATHFYSPSGQAARAGDGRQQVPDWAPAGSQTASVGGNVYFAPEGRVTYRQAPGGATPGAAQSPGITFGGQQDAPDPGPAPAPSSGPDAATAATLARWGVGATPTSDPSAAASPGPSPAATAPDAATAATLARWGVAPAPQAADAAPVSFGAPADKPATDPSAPSTGAAASAVAGAISGVPIVGPYALGGLERVSAFQRSMDGGGSYADELAKVKAADAAREADHPVASAVGKVGGAALGMAPAIMAAPGLLGAAGTLGERTLMGGLSGSAIGGADAAARGDNPLTGAAFGGLGGAAGPAAGNLLGFYAGKAGNALLDAGGTVGNFLRTGTSSGLPGYSRAATNLLTKAAGYDGGGNALMAGAQALGPDATVMDVGPSMKGLALGVTATPSEGKSALEGFVNGRAAGSDARVMNALGGVFGDPSRDPVKIAAQMDAARSAATGPIYEAGYASAPALDAGPVLKVVDDELQHATGEQAKALRSIRKELTTVPGGPGEDSAFVRTPASGGDVGEPPAHLDDVPFHDPSATMTAPPSPGMPRPQSLSQFVRAAGGIQDPGGDLKSMGLGSLIARPGQGLGADAMRQAAGQAGYLGGEVGGGSDDAARFTTVNHLFNALEDGDRTFSVHDDDAVHAWGQYDDAKAAYQRQQADSDGTSRLAGARPTAPGLAFGGPDAEPDPSAALQAVRSDSRGLHNLRMDIDTALEGKAPALGVQSGALAKSQASVQAVRNALDGVLKAGVPGMPEADATFSHLADVQNALAEGHDKVLGALGPHPDTFAATRAAMDPDVAAAQNIGIAGKVYRTFGTGTRRDAVKLGNLLAGGEDGYNTRNLQTAFGEEPVNALLDTVAREKAFNDTANKIAQNSVTARVQGGAKMLAEAEPGSTNLLNASLAGVGLQAGKAALVDPLVRAIMSNPEAPLASEVARALTAQGAGRDEVLTQIARLGAQQGRIADGTNALLRIGNRAGQSAAAGAGETNRTPALPFTNRLTGL